MTLPAGITLADINLSIGQPPARSSIEDMDWTALDHLFTATLDEILYHLWQNREGKWVITQPKNIGYAMGA